MMEKLAIQHAEEKKASMIVRFKLVVQ